MILCRSLARDGALQENCQFRSVIGSSILSLNL